MPHIPCGPLPRHHEVPLCAPRRCHTCRNALHRPYSTSRSLCSQSRELRRGVQYRSSIFPCKGQTLSHHRRCLRSSPSTWLLQTLHGNRDKSSGRQSDWQSSRSLTPYSLLFRKLSRASCRCGTVPLSISCFLQHSALRVWHLHLRAASS